MGYNIYVVEHDFTILAKDLDAAYEAACALNHATDANKGGGSLRGRHFSWVSDDYDETCTNLLEVMAEWRYDCFLDVAGSLVINDFTGEKLGDCAQLFGRLAPFVVSGSFIEYQGEDGERWRYIFTDGGFKEQAATITWED